GCSRLIGAYGRGRASRQPSPLEGRHSKRGTVPLFASACKKRGTVPLFARRSEIRVAALRDGGPRRNIACQSPPARSIGGGETGEHSTVQQVFVPLMAGLWLAWVVSWHLAALWRGRKREEAPRREYRLHFALAALGFLLTFLRWPPMAPL